MYQALSIPRPYQNEARGMRAMEEYELQRSFREADRLRRSERKQRSAKSLWRPALRHA